MTGPPGAGKSTLVAALIAELRRAGRPVAVVAVDPSSPITGGAVLGDRVRMQAYAADADVFIRSMASRGHAGGLSSATSAAAAVFDAVGFDVVLIETVGTGQSEVEVAAAADTTVVVEAPEMGDEIQAIKAGLLEVADIIVVNKGDRPGAHRTAGQLQAMLVGVPREARPGRPAPKHPEVLVTTAATGEGVADLLAAIDRHRSAAGGSDGESARLQAGRGPGLGRAGRSAARARARAGRRRDRRLRGRSRRRAVTCGRAADPRRGASPLRGSSRDRSICRRRRHPGWPGRRHVRVRIGPREVTAGAAVPGEPGLADRNESQVLAEEGPQP